MSGILLGSCATTPFGYYLRCSFLFTRLRQPAVSLAAYRAKTLAADVALPLPEQRRMDAVIDNLDFIDRPYGLDITIVSPHNAAYSCKASLQPGAVAIEAERLKLLKYNAACRAEGMEFVPLAIDVNGSIGSSARAAFWSGSCAGSSQHHTSHVSEVHPPKFEYPALAIPTVSPSMRATAVAVNRRRL